MPYINDEVFDQGLDYFAGQTDIRVDITVGEATNYTEATGLYNGTTQLSCGNKTALTAGATEPADAGGGRQVAIPAINDGDVTATQTADSWAVSDVSATTLIAAGALTASQAVTDGNTFTLSEILIIHRDATQP